MVLNQTGENGQRWEEIVGGSRVASSRIFGVEKCACESHQQREMCLQKEDSGGCLTAFPFRVDGLPVLRPDNVHETTGARAKDTS